MKLITIKYYNLFGILLFFINPLLSLFYTLFYFIKKRNCIFGLSLSLSLIFIYQPLMYDTSANFFTLLQREDFNLYLFIPRELKLNFNIDYYYSIFFYTFIIFYCWFKTISHLTKGINNKVTLNILLTLSISSIIYRDIMDLNRFYLSISIAFYYVYYIKNVYNKFPIFYFFCFLLLCFSIHTFSMVIFFAFFISHFINKNHIYIIYIVSCFFIGVISDSLMKIIISNVDLINLRIPSAYLSDGGWGHNEYSENTLLRKVLECFIVFNLALIGMLYKLKNKNKHENININLIVIFCGLCFLFFSFKTLFERSFITLSVFSIFLFSLNIKNGFLKYLLLVLFLFRFIIINFVRYGSVFTNGHTDVLPDYSSKFDIQLKPLYVPTIFLLDLDNGYSDKFIQNNSIWK
ncbi:hypothetical protein HBM99_16750 [Providencia heimbachae]|uniref:EpsG family protein n=2 Tax=Providencia heimbachae TaxID=333962 RepID=UPI00093A805C|nr:hypothetical protein [Providencia heimbachae]